jgi:hypothetical protein
MTDFMRTVVGKWYLHETSIMVPNPATIYIAFDSQAEAQVYLDSHPEHKGMAPFICEEEDGIKSLTYRPSNPFGAYKAI